MLCGGPSFPKHSLPCPLAPWAMGEGSVVCVDVGPAGCQSVPEGVHRGGERGCCVMCAGPIPRRFLFVAWVPRTMSRSSGVLGEGPVGCRIFKGIVQSGGRGFC